MLNPMLRLSRASTLPAGFYIWRCAHTRSQSHAHTRCSIPCSGCQGQARCLQAFRSGDVRTLVLNLTLVLDAQSHAQVVKGKHAACRLLELEMCAHPFSISRSYSMLNPMLRLSRASALPAVYWSWRCAHRSSLKTPAGCNQPWMRGMRLWVLLPAVGPPHTISR